MRGRAAAIAAVITGTAIVATLAYMTFRALNLILMWFISHSTCCSPRDGKEIE